MSKEEVLGAGVIKGVLQKECSPQLARTSGDIHAHLGEDICGDGNPWTTSNFRLNRRKRLSLSHRRVHIFCVVFILGT